MFKPTESYRREHVFGILTELGESWSYRCRVHVKDESPEEVEGLSECRQLSFCVCKNSPRGKLAYAFTGSSWNG